MKRVIGVLVRSVVLLGCFLPVVSAVAEPGNIVWDPLDTSPDRASRCLRFRVDPPTTGLPGLDAIKVTMVDLQNPDPPNDPCYPPPNFGAYESATCTAGGEANGCARWVGKPGTFLEYQDVPILGNYRAARLQCTPFYFDWITETATAQITVVGAELLPSSTYSVQAYASSCLGAETGCTDVSAAIQMLTRRSGDVWPGYNPPSATMQPDGLDIQVVVNKFKHLFGAPTKAVAQLQPNLLELNADVGALDIATVTDALKGFAYPFSGPCACPSQVTCNATACSNPAPCGGGMCVKTCNSGANAGDPCLDNIHDHCPGGTCPSTGFCRDRCGRCN